MKQPAIFDIIKSLHSETKIVILIFIKRYHCVNATKLSKLINRTRVNTAKQLNELRKTGILISSTNGKETDYKYAINLDHDIDRMIDSILNAYEKCEYACTCLKKPLSKKECLC